MDKKEFYKKIDQLSEQWYVDANKPVKGNWGSSIHGKKTGPRRKTNFKGEENPINESSGEVQIIKWTPVKSFCERCCKVVEDRCEFIDLAEGRIKCEKCGAKYPKKIHVLEAD
jgi:hypothetical protein